MNKLPRQKVHQNLAARQRASYLRKKAKLTIFQKVAQRVEQGLSIDDNVISQFMNELPEEQKQAFESFSGSRDSVTNLKLSAG
jgi:uncharacterized protein YggL (DUF469 family)